MRFVRLMPFARVAATNGQSVGRVTSSAPPNACSGPWVPGANDRIAIMRKPFIGAALAALIGTPVFAADMLVISPPAPAYSWGGFYVGGNVGWLGIEGVGLSRTPADGNTSAFLGLCSAAGACPTSIGSAQGNAVTGGGQFGFNWQVQNWVVGLEADVGASGANASGHTNVQVAPFAPYSATQNIKENEFGTIRGRAGLLLTPTFLAYVTGGFAWASTKQSLAIGFPSLAETAGGAAASTAIGGTVGAGLEWALGDRWSVAGEYLYARLGANSLSFQTAPLGAGCTPGGVPSCQLNVSESGFSNNVARLKLNYKIF